MHVWRNKTRNICCCVAWLKTVTISSLRPPQLVIKIYWHLVQILLSVLLMNALTFVCFEEENQLISIVALLGLKL